MKKTNLEKYFELLISIEMFKTRKDNTDKTIAERREIALNILKLSGQVQQDYQ